MGLRGVGLVSHNSIFQNALSRLRSKPEDAEGNPPKKHIAQEIMYNPKVVAHSVQTRFCDGEGCLRRPRRSWLCGRHARVTVEYYNKEGEKQRVKLQGTTHLFKHEIDHTNGIAAFTTGINKYQPFAIKDGLLIIE